jgi:hypothetical protein
MGIAETELEAIVSVPGEGTRGTQLVSFDRRGTTDRIDYVEVVSVKDFS